MVAINQTTISHAVGEVQPMVDGADLVTETMSTPASKQDKMSEQHFTSQKSEELGQALDGERALLQLPSDFLKTPTTPYQPKYCALTLLPELVASLQVRAQQDALDVRTLLLTAFNTLLYRYTQQATIDLALTLPTATHGTRTTVIRTHLDAAFNARTLSAQIAIALNEVVHDVQGLPQAASLDRLNQPANDHTALPIAVTFVEEFFRVSGKQQLLSDFQAPTATATQSHDLHLIVLQQAGQLSGILQYNASLFQTETIQRLSGHLAMLLQGIVYDPEQAIAQLPLLTETERQQLADWQSPTVIYPQTPVHKLFEARVVEQPEAIALRFQDQQLTYTALNERANQLAHYLMQAGVRAGLRVAVYVEPSLEVLVSLLGIFKAGGVYLPLDPTHPADRIATILEETQPPVLLTQSHLLERLPVSTAQVLCLEQAQAVLQPLPTHNPAIAVPLEQTSHLVYTSGTTGKPKGVMTSHGNLVNYILTAQERFGFNHQDVMPAIARFTFSITMFELLSPLVAGGTLVILERDHILDFKRMVQTLQQVTVIHTSPSLWQKLLAYIQDNGIDHQLFDGLRHVSTGGDMVPVALLETMRRVFQTAEVYVIYGCSEVSCMGCSYPVVSDRPIKSRVGKPFPNVAVRLYDADQNLVPIGVPGEIYIGGAGVTQGYWQREALTQEKFVTLDGQRFYRTGDVGRLDAEGNLEMLGRADFQIKLRGIRIELGEIEATLRQAPGVREGIVMACELGARTGGQGEKSLVAYVVLDPAHQPPIENIRSLLQEKLPDYMVPAAFVVLDAMPVNLNQKVDRRALPLPTPANMAGFKPFVAPRNACEQQLTDIWETVLGVEAIGIHDNFFEVGGHSLLAVSLMAQIETVFGKTLPLSVLVTEPTIAQLAALLSQSGQLDQRCSLVLLRKGGTRPPVFFIHDGEGETLLYRNLAYCLKPEHPVYGIQPYSQERHPILHTRIAEMATYYIEQIRTVQPDGPYLLGGLCVGGFLAFEIARQLQKHGQTVAMVALIDTADVEATVRTGLIAQKRLNSFSQSLSSGQQLAPQQFFSMLKKVSQKLYNLIAYEVGTKLEKVQNQTKIKLFRYYLDRNLPIPAFLNNLSVRLVLKFAEREYVPQAAYEGEVLLFLATKKSNAFDGTFIDDTPYAEIYSDPLLGWGNRATEGIKVYDNPGGHSSMLQEPNVRVMADKMQAYIDDTIADATIATVANAQPSPRVVALQPEHDLASSRL